MHARTAWTSVGITLGSAAQIALFVAPVLVLLSYALGPTPMNLQFWPGAVAMMLIATLTATSVVDSGRSEWFMGVLVLMVYLIFAMTLCHRAPHDDGLSREAVVRPLERWMCGDIGPVRGGLVFGNYQGARRGEHVLPRMSCTGAKNL